MKAIDLPAVRQGSGAQLFRRRLVDEAECPSEGPESDQRCLFMLRTFSTQPDLWRVPQTTGRFSKLKMEWVGGHWTIELEKLGPATASRVGLPRIPPK